MTTSGRVESIVATLRAAGKRVTIPKRTVIEVLDEATAHLTADEITHAVQSRHPDVSPSTVYRILEELETLNVVVHSHMTQHAAVYHLAGAVHGHLICSKCAATFEIPAEHFDQLSEELWETYRFTLDRHHVAITGLCRACLELGHSRH